MFVGFHKEATMEVLVGLLLDATVHVYRLAKSVAEGAASM